MSANPLDAPNTQLPAPAAAGEGLGEGASVPALALENITFAYNAGEAGEPIARGVSLAVARGEMVGLLGPNGAGKSTLLKLVSGALRPQAGRALVEGREALRLPHEELARRVALAPQDFTVQFAYTVRQVVELGRMPHLGAWGTLRPRDRQAVDAALDEVGLAPLAERIFDELSGGERQRALIALTLAQAAPIVLLDEPTAHLDIRHQIETLELLRRLNHERGLTVIATMHDLNLAARYFPRLIVYKRGVVADGPPTEALDEATLSAVYETPVRVGILRGDERLSVHPPARPYSPRPLGEAESPRASGAERVRARPLRAHVIAGGGSGELVMRALADAGVAFAAGPLNVGDSDCALAERLATLTLVEPPYAPLSPEGLAAARERMIEAGAVILCPTPLGPGNIALLEEALAARQAGARVILLEPGLGAGLNEPSEGDGATSAADAAGLELVAARDFSGPAGPAGRGRAAYAALLASGARWATTPKAALRLTLDGAQK